MTKPATLSDNPFLNSPAFRANIPVYQGKTKPKALAVSIDGSWYGFADDFVVEGVNINAKTNEEASRIVLERCEANAKLIPCTLLAVGDQIVLDVKNMNWTPRLDVTRKTLSKPVPFIPDVYWDSFWTQRFFPNGQAANFVGFIYSSGSARAYIISGANTESTAQTNCQQLNNGVPCKRLAMNGNYTMTTAFFEGTANMDLHCKVMPRASCEAHRAVGCTTSGVYHIISAGELKEMNCTF